MKGRVILIDRPKERASQAALLVDGKLEDLLLDPPKGDMIPAPGEIYWAKVDRLVSKMGGAFVKLTPNNMGFLRDAKGLKEGQGILLQVTSYAEQGKATPVTGRILYKGRRVIHTPDAPGINVSRQIRDEAERARLIGIIERAVAEEAQDSETDLGGFIVRTAANEAPERELIREVGATLATRNVCKAAQKGTAPGDRWLHASPAMVTAIREWTAEPPDRLIVRQSHYRAMQIEEIWEDGPMAGLLAANSGDIRDRAEPFDGPDLFDHYGVWDEIERLKSPRVDLPSGAWMAVEATRAMVTIDVNTAGEFGGGAPLTANLEAAKELPRQLRLRGLGGQIVIDFAPLKKTGRKRIEEALKAAFRKDPIETTLAGWTPLGNFELQRKRDRRPLTELLKPE
jgi:Rne/Rng family ribonuclease